jgi:predicted esterase
MQQLAIKERRFIHPRSFLIMFLLLSLSVVPLAPATDLSGETFSIGRSSQQLQEPENFTIVAIPDTQFYSESYPAVFDSQTDWITSNTVNMNIKFVTHEGDIVNNGGQTYQWINANRSLSKLDGYVPWAVLPATHDDMNPSSPSDNYANYNIYFPYSRFSSESWYGGAYNNINTNSFELFSGGYDDYLIFHFQYHPTDAILQWANTTIANYPNRRVIVTTHDYMDVDGSRRPEGDHIWNNFVSHHADQIFLVLCGHMHAENRRNDTVNGHTVYQLLADYQEGYPYGGNGWLRILNFCPAEDKIYVKSYSPYVNEYQTDANSQFTLEYDMTSEADPTRGEVDFTPSLSGDYRWMDVANETYSEAFQENYNYTQALVHVSYDLVGESLTGELTGQNLKPNFAYQLKIVGTPGTDDNELIGLAGRWWEQVWTGSSWSTGSNLNNKGNGSSPNPNDETYFARCDIVDEDSDTGFHYKYTGYLVFAYFITNSNGDATLSFETGSCFHVLWKTDQRTPESNDGPVKTVTFDPEVSEPAYDVDYVSQTISMFGEWERLPMGSVGLAAGNYDCQMVLTEESFHGSGPLDGNWAAAMTGNVSFTIAPRAQTFMINLESPEDGALTMDNMPDFSFTATHISQTTFNCSLWLENATKSFAYATKNDVANGSSTTLTPTTPIPTGDWSWWINCTDGTNIAVSEKRTITISTFRGDKTFTSTLDGSIRTYWLDLPDNFDNSTPTSLVVFLHGYGGSRLSYPQKYPSLRQTFQSNTWIVASVDCRTVSGYQNWYTEPSRRDITDVLNLVRSDYNIDANHIHVMGNSMGGGGALKYAMFNNGVIASLVDIHGITNFTQFYNEDTQNQFRASLRTAYGGTPSQVPTVYANESALGNEQRFNHTPVMIVHGTADDTVNVSQSRYLNQSLSALGYAVKYIEVPGVSHNASILISGREMEIFNWFRDHPLVANSNLHPAYLVARGSNNGIYYRTHDSITESWDSWTSVPGSTPNSPAATVTNNELHLVVRGMNGGQIWHSYVNLSDNSFSGWTLLSGATPSAPTLTANSTHLCLVVRGNNNVIYYRFYNVATRVWGDWVGVPNGSTPSTPVAELVDGELHVAVRGSNFNQIWHGVVDLGSGGFSGWMLLSGATPSSPVLTSNSTHLCLVVRGDNNVIYYRWYDLAFETWGGWTGFPYGSTPDVPAATITGDTLQIVVRGMNNNQIWHGALDLTSDVWSGWTLLDGSTPSKPMLTS